jgi:putative spermidine/putrescine transport system permease protein
MGMPTMASSTQPVADVSQAPFGANANEAATAATAATAAKPGARRFRRHGDVRGALLLIAPLVLFMLVFFAVPIASLLTRGVWDDTVSRAFPGTRAELHEWHDRRAVPPPAAFSALAHDILAADDAGTLGDAAARLNQSLPGMRALLIRTRHHLDDQDPSATPDASASKQDLSGFDARWNAASTWQVLDRALTPLTADNVLRALDHTQRPDGRIVSLGDDEGVYLSILGRTFWISAVVTVIVTLLGYPLAYWLNGLPASRQRLVMMAVLIPFWTSILVRICAWMVVLPRSGLVNRVLLSAGAIDHPLALLYNRTGVYISMVHILIPFMVLPLVAVMRNVPRNYTLAAISLGSHPFGAFWRVYLPQTLPGLAAGTMLVFISALGYYIAPALLGGAGDQMLSYYIAYFTNVTVNWGLAAALAMLLLVATAALFAVYRLAAGRRLPMEGF